MAGGFRDLFALVLGWKSAGTPPVAVPATAGPDYTFPADRLHYTFPADRRHYMFPYDRKHYVVGKG